MILQLRVYTVAKVQAELEIACRDYLMATVGVNKRKRVFLPKILTDMLAIFHMMPSQ
jgi:hypothetical protein